MKTKLLPPPDQVIVDNYFKLVQSRGMSSAAWMFGMLATYGIRLSELKDFNWNADNTLNIKTKKRKVKPLHPQWLFLFQLKEKQPSNLEDCFEKIETKLISSIETQKISLNLTDLQLAYQLRKPLYVKKKVDLRMQSPSSLVPCVR
jgi:hypothetical protein